MNSAAHDELRMLRARAYGPAADIHDDPAALRRLRELEAEAASAVAETTSERSSPVAPIRPPLPAVPAPVAAARRQPRRPEPVVGPTGDGAAASRPRVAPRRWQLSRGFAVLWLISLVAVATVAAAVTFTASRVMPGAPHAGAKQVASLTLNPDFSWPVDFGFEDGAGADFHGLTVARFSLPITANTTADCLLAFAASAAGSDAATGTSSTLYGCGADPFPATVQLTIDASMPAELRDALGESTAVQFVLNDRDEVSVYAKPW